MAERVANHAELEQGALGLASSVASTTPGAIYGDAGVHLTTVRHVKRQAEPVERTWIETDIGLACVDLDRAVAFFLEVLGIPVRDRGELVGEGAGAAVGVTDLRALRRPRPRWRTLELFEIHHPP